MKIELNEEWRINVIPLNFVLEQRMESGKRPDGSDPKEPYKWEVRGYYSSLRAALTALPDFLAQTPSVETLEGFFARWDKLCVQFARSAGK